MAGVTIPSGDATLCISIAARPGRFGVTVHNAAFRALGLDYLYKALAIRDITAAVSAVRTLGIRGCGVSMPFKESVLPLLDVIDPDAKRIGAVNTIVNTDGHLTGYNTDVDGARAALREVSTQSSDSLLLLGAGGVARAILEAARQLGHTQVRVSSRRPEQAQQLADIWGCHTLPWSDVGQASADVVINATPIGMAPQTDAAPLSLDSLSRFRAVIDVIGSPQETALIRAARAAGCRVVTGGTFSLHQAARQFTLYTGCEAPLEVMRRAAESLSNASGK